jgi:hypothetical protein
VDPKVVEAHDEGELAGSEAKVLGGEPHGW